MPATAPPGEGSPPHFNKTRDNLRSGDRDGLAVLYRTYHHRLLRYLRAVEPRLADDLAGEIWVAAAARLRTFEGDPQAFSAWLFTIARNRLADARRRAVRRRTDPVGDLPERQVADFAEDAIGRMEAQEAINVIIAVLSPAQADVVLLRTLADLSTTDIATMLGHDDSWVRVTYSRVLIRLRAHLAGT